MLVLVFSATIIDTITSTIMSEATVFSGLLRPIMFANNMASVRHNALNLLYDIRDSSVILFAILMFIFIYANVGHLVFRDMNEGFLYFPNLAEGTFQMIILITTANFPDVMLPAYDVSYWWSFFFIAYLVIGLYCLLNFLLAQIFNNLSKRLASQGAALLGKGEKFLKEFIDRHDTAAQEKSYLTQTECE